MNARGFKKSNLGPVVTILMATLLASASALAGPRNRSVFVLTSTNSSANNEVEVFRLDTDGTPSLSLANTLSTGAKGGASGNAGILQFQDNLGAVANYGSNNVTQLVRYGNYIGLGRTISLARDCVQPDSLALASRQMYVVGSNCAESHAWPSGNLSGNVVNLTDASAAQIAVGNTWAAVTLKSGSVLQLPLRQASGALSGTSTAIALPSNANDTPLGEAFWGDLLGFTPAHSPNSFALIDSDRDVSPIAGPTPAFPGNAPCWVAKGPLSVWYTGNTPGQAISIFLTDGQGGLFYKSIPLPGGPTDIAVSADFQWLAVIYSAGGEAYVAVYSIDAFGDLTLSATSPALGVPSFSGVAISE